MKLALNIRDEVTLEVLQAHFRAHGVMPAQYKVALRLGLSPSSTDIVRAAYAKLERAGLIRRLSPSWRRIKLVEPEDNDAADFARRICPDTHYAEQRKFVEALSQRAPLGLIPKLRGLKPLSERTKVFWRDGFPSPPVRGAA